MIRWREAMSVDGGVIDDDHKHLIDIINHFEEIAADGLTRGEAVEVLSSLQFYASTHFRREESLQKVSRYPHHEAHKQEHANLEAALEKIIAGLRDHDDRIEAAAAKEIGGLLRHWLLDHVLETDRKMRPYVDVFKERADAIGILKDIEYLNS